MLPESKYKSRKASNLRGELLVTNITTSDPYRPTAVNQYIAKKNKEIKDIYEEIRRITNGYQVEI